MECETSLRGFLPSDLDSLAIAGVKPSYGYSSGSWRPSNNSKKYFAYISNHLQTGEPQKKMLWCWAASIETVLKYHGCSISQGKIVEGTFGDLRNSTADLTMILSSLNRMIKDDNNDIFVARALSYKANPLSAAFDLISDKPLIIGSLSHAMVLLGITYTLDNYGMSVNRVEVYDPWPNHGRRDLNAVEFANMAFAARIDVKKIDLKKILKNKNIENK